MKIKKFRRVIKKTLIALALGAAATPVFATGIEEAIYAIVQGINWYYVAFVVAASVISSDQSRRSLHHQADDARRAFNAGLQERSVTALRAIPPYRVVYGRTIGGGDVRAVFTSDKTATRSDGTSVVKPDAYKHLVITFADHQCQALNEVYIGGVAIQLASVDVNGWVTTGPFSKSGLVFYGEVTIAIGGTYTSPYALTVLAAVVSDGLENSWSSGSYTLTVGNTLITNTSGSILSVSYSYTATTSWVRCSFHLGTTTQTVDTYLNGVIPTQWTTNHRLQGHAYVVITLDLEQQQFQGGPPEMTFDVSGKLLFDPRSSTTVYSNNPALCARDFLLANYGYDMTSANVDDTYVIAAANASDAGISFTDLVTGAFTSGFNTDAVLDGWAATSNGTATVAGGLLTWNATGVNMELTNAGLTQFAGSQYQGIRIRFKRVAGAGWLGRVYYSIAAGHTYSASFYKQIAEPTYDPITGYAEMALWDMSALTVGTTDWNTHSINGIRLAFGTTSSDQFLIDWINVGPLTLPTYTCNGQFTTDDDKEQVLREIVATMAGSATYGAKWLVQAGAFTASVMDLADDDLHGQIAMPQSDEGLDTLYNGIRGTFIAAGAAQPSDFDPYQVAAYVTDDGQELWDNVTLPFTDNKTRAKFLCKIRVELNRQGTVITYPAKLRAWPVQIGDRVRVTSTEYGYSLKTFRVTDWQFDATSSVALTMREDFSTTYDFTAPAGIDKSTDSGLPTPWLLSALTGVTATSVAADQAHASFTVRVRVAWNVTTDAYMANGRIQIQWRRIKYDTPNTFQTVEVPGTEVQAYLIGPAPGDILAITVRPINELGVIGPSFIFTHTVASIAVITDNSNLIASSGVSLVGNTAVKTAHSLATWDEQVYSRDAYVNGAYAVATLANAALPITFGLNSDPLTDASYASVDFAIETDLTPKFNVYANGVLLVGPLTTVVTGDTIAVLYDGAFVYFILNGVIKLNYAVDPNLKLYLDSSFYTLGSSLTNIRFGPMSAVTGILPGQLLDSAQGGALNADPSCTDMRAWLISGGWPRTVVRSIIDGPAGPTCLRMTNAGGLNWLEMIPVPLLPGKTYRVSCWARRVSGTGDFYLRLTTTGTTLGLVDNHIGVEAIAYGTTWVRYQGQLTLPTDTNITGRGRVFLNNGGAGISDVSDIQDFRLEEVINTDLLKPAAATEIYSVTAVSATITGIQGTPENSARFTTIASLTFTPSYDGIALAHFTGSFSYINSVASISGAFLVIADNALGGTATLWNANWGPWCIAPSCPPSTSVVQGVDMTREFAVTGGVSYTLGFFGNKLNSGDTVTMINGEFRVEVVKR